MDDLTGHNRLLACLPAAERHLLLRDAVAVTLRPPTELYPEEGQITQVYFPLTLMALILIRVGGRTEVEVAAIGNEGMLGSTVGLGLARELGRTIVQVSGRAWQLPVEALQARLAPPSLLPSLLARYHFALARQVALASACHRLHSMEERCARWLLMTHDRVERDTFVLTQRFLAAMLGVRRATVGLVMGLFRRAGLLTYVRGYLHLRNRPGLEALTCPCYALIREEYRRLTTHTST